MPEPIYRLKVQGLSQLDGPASLEEVNPHERTSHLSTVESRPSADVNAETIILLSKFRMRKAAIKTQKLIY